MKIVIACCWSPEKGQGISTISREIAEALVKKGHKVYYLSPPTNNFFWYERFDIKPIFVGPELNPKAGLIATVNAITDINADVVINNDHPYVQAALPALKARRIVFSHTMSWATASLVEFNNYWADKIIVISYDMLLKLTSKGVPSTKLVLIMNGAEDPHNNEWKPEIHLDKPLNLVFAGNWTRLKGAHLIQELIDSFPDNHPWLELNVFGSIKDKYTKKIGAKPWVKIHGRVSRDQFVNAMDKADILLFPSAIEGCPMTVIEALSRGVIPIISDGHGAMRWMIDHGIDGYIARSKYWKSDLIGILQYLHNNRTHLYEMRCQARIRYLNQFRIDYMIEKISALMQASDEGLLSTNNNGPVQAIKWHRPNNQPEKNIRRIIDTICYRLGILQKSGLVKLNEIH